MKTNILIRSMIGLGYGGLFTFTYMSILLFSHYKIELSQLWFTTLAFMLIGLYFGLSSFIYSSEKWSMLKKTIVHFMLSILAFYIIMLSTGIIPADIWTLLANFIIFTLIYSGFWFGHILYYRRIIKEMNNSIK
ncbi:DUF3021 domain-containing protein [Virgibacillus sp. SK37]|uniref:DUF3021 domain-containing protein n=1 Tax=Virgibacillus sp. SK37 TaxID=403957 RepID=UPI0004D1A2FF|nr:DUF3021 domain-containing protein [Virgibacillus sp. SK37]AIF45341.1 hypothetical protein X953_07440 [Virgibacillus sp. SK37]